MEIYSNTSRMLLFQKGFKMETRAWLLNKAMVRPVANLWGSPTTHIGTIIIA